MRLALVAHVALRLRSSIAVSKVLGNLVENQQHPFHHGVRRLCGGGPVAGLMTMRAFHTSEAEYTLMANARSGCEAKSAACFVCMLSQVSRGRRGGLAWPR